MRRLTRAVAVILADTLAVAARETSLTATLTAWPMCLSRDSARGAIMMAKGVAAGSPLGHAFITSDDSRIAPGVFGWHVATLGGLAAVLAGRADSLEIMPGHETRGHGCANTIAGSRFPVAPCGCGTFDALRPVFQADVMERVATLEREAAERN